MEPAKRSFSAPRTTILLVLALLAFPGGAPRDVRADTPGPADMTREQGAAILEELKAIRGLLERIEKQGLERPGRRAVRPTSATLTLDGEDPVLGAADAPVTVIEFTDFQCPYCKRFNQTTFPQIKHDYIDAGKVRWIVRDLPMSFHTEARKAGQAAHCAGEQGKYWEMREILFGNSPKLDPGLLPGFAQVIGLDVAAFNACLASERHLTGIDRDRQAADGARITGTPSFVIGRVEDDTLNGRLIIGAQASRVFTAEFDRLLAQADARQEDRMP
jgi:protein-disulfide isomerase